MYATPQTGTMYRETKVSGKFAHGAKVCVFAGKASDTKLNGRESGKKYASISHSGAMQ